jgi:hypothetical protein
VSHKSRYTTTESLIILFSQYRTMASYPYPSSTCSTNGSVNGLAIHLCYHLPVPPCVSNGFPTLLFILPSLTDTINSLGQSEASSTSTSMEAYDSNGVSSYFSTTSNKNDLSIQRIEDFVKNPIDSQILHYHSSTEISMNAHRSSMKTCLRSFDAAYKG